MRALTSLSRTVLSSAGLLGLLLAAAPTLHAQQRMLLPEGTVLTARTNAALSSATATEGTLFMSTVTDSVRVEGFTVIPEGSTIEGQVTFVRRATSRESGVIGVEFNRIILPNRTAIAIDGKLTSTDPAERRQIDAQGDARVVFVGGRSGAGAAIGGIGGGNANDPISGILGALGGLLSKGTDVTVPANTAVAVQLERGLVLSVSGTATQRPDAFTIYTSAEMIRAAQTALRARNYYRGPMDGVLSNDTQRALFEFQIDNDILATGNLDGRTAQALDLQATSGAVALTAAEAGLVRRNAQVLTGRWRDYLAITPASRLDPRRSYTAAELEFYFALSAFTDNASLYEQMVRVSGHADGLGAAGQALIVTARRVDTAMAATRPPARTAAAWAAIQAELNAIDPAYPTR